ncbi:hypothetical protein MNBD_DELTA01-910 [hydrothermal vent metagenome]|uniref:DUF3108 domain-containing protein n=1 Tax=hydrothermal vent metagenome TaxID=652676 RepID=A0A3B0QQJ4_9ZZZZ
MIFNLKYKRYIRLLSVLSAFAFLLFGSGVFAAGEAVAASAKTGGHLSIGESFLGEELNYKVGFWIFNNVAIGRLTFQGKDGIYEASLSAHTTGLARFVRRREDTFVARMEAVPGGARLRTLSFEKVSKLDGKVRRKLVEIDYGKGVLRWRKWKNGKLRKSGEQPIPEGVVYDDPLTAFYNLRYGAYGSVRDAAAFTIKTLPTDEGKDIDMTVRFAGRKETEARRGAMGVGEGFLADASLDKELFDSKSGLMEIYFNPDMVVTYAVAKDVLFFGDVRGELLPAADSK